jgi:hypothetical protein
MKLKRILIMAILAVSTFTFAACNNDEDEGTSGVCSNLAAQAASTDCLNGVSESDYASMCDAMIADESCGAERKAVYNCQLDGTITCDNGTIISVPPCTTEKEALNTCIFDSF